MRIIACFAVSILILLSACQPDLGVDPQEPVALPNKIVEIDVNNDSAVIFLNYSSSGDIIKMVTNNYETGIMTGTDTAYISYYADGKINWYLNRERDIAGGDYWQMDQFFFKDASGKINGFRVADRDGTRPPDYYRYLYDNNNRLQKVILELDSADYFSQNVADYNDIDSLVYDAAGRVTEEYSLSKNLITGVFSTTGRTNITGYDTRAGALPAGINNYSIFEESFFLSSSQPNGYHFENFYLGRSGDIAYHTIYDASGRPVKTDATSTGDAYVSGYGLQNASMKQRLFYY